MKHLQLFEEFVNEAANLPKEAKELAKMFKGGSWRPHFELEDVWIFSSSELEDVDLQINWNSSKDWGDIGFQIADEDGNELYIGKDPKKAAVLIKGEINESDSIEEVKKVPMIKDIIENAKLSQWVKNDRIDIGWKHDWLKKPKTVKALTDLKVYETSVETVKFPGGVVTKFIKTYDDGVDKLEVVYDRDIRKSS